MYLLCSFLLLGFCVLFWRPPQAGFPGEAAQKFLKRINKYNIKSPLKEYTSVTKKESVVMDARLTTAHISVEIW